MTLIGLTDRLLGNLERTQITSQMIDECSDKFLSDCFESEKKKGTSHQTSVDLRYITKDGLMIRNYVYVYDITSELISVRICFVRNIGFSFVWPFTAAGPRCATSGQHTGRQARI